MEDGLDPPVRQPAGWIFCDGLGSPLPYAVFFKIGPHNRPEIRLVHFFAAFDNKETSITSSIPAQTACTVAKFEAINALGLML